MATANHTHHRPGTVLLSVPGNIPLVALAAVLAPFGKALRYRPDKRPRTPHARIRAASAGGAL